MTENEVRIVINACDALEKAISRMTLKGEASVSPLAEGDRFNWLLVGGREIAGTSGRMRPEDSAALAIALNISPIIARILRQLLLILQKEKALDPREKVSAFGSEGIADLIHKTIGCTHPPGCVRCNWCGFTNGSSPSA